MHALDLTGVQATFIQSYETACTGMHTIHLVIGLC